MLFFLPLNKNNNAAETGILYLKNFQFCQIEACERFFLMHVLQINTSKGEEKVPTKHMESKIYPITHNTIDFNKPIHLASQ